MVKIRPFSVSTSLARAFHLPISRPSAPKPFTPVVRSLSTRSPKTPLRERRVGETSSLSRAQVAGFSTTPALGKKSGKAVKKDARLTMIRYALYHPTRHMPRPLRFSRLRWLRHWTIHRAWQLYQANLRRAHTLSLKRQFESMQHACEELRLNVGDGGRLYRIAISKKGTWGGRSVELDGTPSLEKRADLEPGKVAIGGRIVERGDKGRVEKGREGGFPIELVTGLVDFPRREGWDHGWTR